MNAPAITAEKLTKTFGSTRALDDFDISVPAGQVTGFLGPNGAGKSTALRVFLGLLKASSGSVQVLGRDPWAESVDLHRRIAYVAGDTNLWPNLSGGEIIDLLTRHQRSAAQQTRRDELIERFQLDPTKKARTYSKGNRQKVALISALSLEVDLYIFDEPTSGLDPLMEAVFTEEVRALRDQGRTVLLSSHILGEVEKLCDRVTIIRAGTDVEHGTLSELRHLSRSSVTATTRADPSPLRRLPGTHDLTIDDGRIHFSVDNAQVNETLRVLSGMGVDNLTVAPPSLEDLFLRHYETPDRGEVSS